MRSLLVATTIFVAVGGRPAQAARELPAVDAFTRSPPSGSEPSARERAKGVDVAHEEPRLGVPTFVWGARAAQPGAKSLRPVPPEQVARTYLGEQAGLYRLGRTDAPHIPVRGVHRASNGASIVTFGQEVEGIEVFRQSLKVLLDADNQLVAMSGHLSPVASNPRLEKEASAFRLEPREAIALAWRDLHGDPLPAVSLSLMGQAQGAYSHYALSPGPRLVVFSSPARVKQVFFPLPEVLVPAWYVELDTTPVTATDGDQYAYVISAVDGQVLYRHDLSSHQSYTYRVWADTQSPHIPYDGPQGNAATPHPTGLPDGYQAPFVAPNLLTLQNTPFSRNDPWLPMGATQTVGNNVDAYVDLVAPSGFGAGDLRGSLGGSGIFGDGYDLMLAPSVTDAQQMSSVAQIFYVTNFLHDWYYDSGFDEAAGNAQTDNYGRGGLGADNLRAEGQDYVGRNNANMFTPSDGARPRMQMYVYDTKGPRGMDVSLEHPLGGRLPVGVSAFGPQQFNVTAAVAFAEDGVAGPEGSVADACQPLTNAAAVAGRIVLADMQGCDYTVKATHAQAAGAVGLVIVPQGEIGSQFFVPGRAPSITIPVVSVEQYVGGWFRFQAPESVTLLRQGADRDGTLDNTIIAHEWMHYMSNRLIGDANGLTNNQGRSMGEGWGDFAGLLMVVREGDDQLPSNANFNGVYARGAYVNSGGANQGYYWGSRRYPYTTDLTKNPLTLRYIENGVRLPAGIPVSFGSSGVNNAEVHSSGEVWAVTLWECYAALLRDKERLTFAQAQQRMKEYLVASMKLTPNAPTFLEARDALLAVAHATDRADYILFAQAFAKRGAGTRAVAPSRDSTDHVGVVESFTSGKDVLLASVEVVEQTGTALSCDDDGTLDTGETVRLRVTLRNSGIERLTQTSVTLSSDTTDLSFPEGATVSVPPTDPLHLVTVEVPVRLSGPASPRVINLTLAYRDADQTVPGDQTQTLTLRVNTDELPGTGTLETVDAANHPWLLAEQQYPDAFPWTRQHAAGDQDWYFHGPDNDTNSDTLLVSPPLHVSATGAFRFTFQYRHVLEQDYDGAVIELSEDGGLTWTDLGAFLSPSYTTLIQPEGGNPIENRMAYSGESEGYPAFIQGVADLGTTYAGKTVLIRFRVGTDASVGARGWDLNDLQFEGLANTPFTTFVPHRGQCINRAPVANAGPAQVRYEGLIVQLTGSGTDPEGAALTYTWTQTAGPAVVLASSKSPRPFFRAPAVTKDTDFTFQLRVHDGVNVSAPSSVTVRVRNIPGGGPAPLDKSTPELGAEDAASVTGANGPVTESAPGWGCSSGPEGSVPGAAVLLLAALGLAMRRPRARAVAVPKH
ncbi:myxosortase-dependent M36 family metallopeptidase [Pyxidicoccus sp. MSG2]|uniref:myxosortase-dependent M36 family metallopeptidase n=1 Tax=Pyxidicoccus sp. MSG2 TaxID=2996790 RepID=UPI00226D41D8|nr:myxosortase-dependent M36 family metallopeptidase [Pyxidicoccus sp. MSG2]MCY1020158.1 myxosortase-dependent M36 family metallopeptidase [Pyxidicoccus sp. MSG2]